MAFNTSSGGMSTTSLGNLSECLTTLTVKHLFLIANLNRVSFSSKPLPFVLLLHALANPGKLTLSLAFCAISKTNLSISGEMIFDHPSFLSAISLPRTDRLETFFRTFQSCSSIFSPQFSKCKNFFTSSTASWKAIIKYGLSDVSPTSSCSAVLVVKYLKEMHGNYSIKWWQN